MRRTRVFGGYNGNIVVIDAPAREVQQNARGMVHRQSDPYAVTLIPWHQVTRVVTHDTADPVPRPQEMDVMTGEWYDA